MKPLKLHKLKDVLINNKPDCPINYTLPDVWNCFNYPPSQFIQTPTQELMVNPYDFYHYLINDVLLPKAKINHPYNTSISLANHQKPKALGGDWIKNAVVYSSMIRTSSAWDSDRSGVLEDQNIYHLKETGTFIKMLAYLPTLVKMGVNTLYLLPISKFSLHNKKGDLGSPYGVSSFTELDPNLKEPMVGDAMTLNEEFQAFVEACHILDIRVMIDIIPRTNAIDNDLIRHHPDWFYWIESDQYDAYKPPFVKGFNHNVVPKLEYMDTVYQSDDVKRHITMFRHNPKALDAKKWDRIKRHKNLPEAIKKHFNLSIAPAFSDYINDVQPPWTDITFFRMYLDHPKDTVAYLDNPNTPPYILFDTIKSNMYAGDKPNMKLWETLSQVVPYYQKQFGIDGARIDMGHALPHDLLQMIFSQARNLDPDFAFIAEELNPKNANAAREKGYNIAIGNGFMMAPRIWEGKAKKYYYETRFLKAPILAHGETHDTPRLASRDGKETLSRVITLLNMFMPNGVPFINSGQEVFEKQPMNLGLDCTEDELNRLDPSDPFYQKLALFDRYQLHYLHPKRWLLLEHLDFIKPIRQKYLKQLMNKKAFVPVEDDNHLFIGFSYVKRNSKNNVLCIFANLNPYHECFIKPNIKNIRTLSKNTAMIGKLMFSTHEFPRDFTQFIDFNTLDIHLGAGEVKIIEI